MQGSPGSVLVVDDDPSLRLLCRVNLELEGFTVREAGSLTEARAAVAEAAPDAVLLDLHVGAEDSRDFLAELREDGIPVALVTGSADVREFTDADAVLSKPFLPAALVATVERLVRVPGS
jgi:two-component system, OmpR family, response regulator